MLQIQECLIATHAQLVKLAQTQQVQLAQGPSQVFLALVPVQMRLQASLLLMPLWHNQLVRRVLIKL